MKLIIVTVLITQCWSLTSIPVNEDDLLLNRPSIQDEYEAIANNAEVKAQSKELLNKIVDPADTELQRQIKSYMAEYLVVTSVADSETENSDLDYSETIAAKAFGRDKHRPHHTSNHNRDRNRNRDAVTAAPAVLAAPVQPQIIYVPYPVNSAPVQGAAAPVASAPIPVQVVAQSIPVAAPAPAPQYVPVAAPAPAPQYVPVAAPAPQYVPVAPAVVQSAPIQNNEVRQEVTTPGAAPVPTIVPVIQGPVATTAPVAVAPPAPVVVAQPPPAAPQVPVVTATQAPVAVTQAPATLRPTVDPVHHLNQVNKILGNVATLNIVGIVDESLAIRAPAPVRTLVTNILKTVFCNPIDRLFNRCAPNQVAAANTRQ